MELREPARSGAAALRARPLFPPNRSRKNIKSWIGGVGKYWLFIGPSVLVILSIVLFPWVFTIWMSVQEWKSGQSRRAMSGMRNYTELIDQRRASSSRSGRTFYFTAARGRSCRSSSALSRPSCSTANFRCAACCAASSSCR